MSAAWISHERLYRLLWGSVGGTWEVRIRAGLSQIEDAIWNDAEDKNGSDEQRDSQDKSRLGWGGVYFLFDAGRLRVELREEAEIVDGSEAAVEQADDGDDPLAGVHGRGEDIKFAEEARSEGNADEREQEDSHGGCG